MKKTLLAAAFAVLPLGAQADLIISGVFDGPLSGGTPKGIELHATADIADLSIYGIESANNGGGAKGVEFTLPADSLNAGDYIYIAYEEAKFTEFFGFAPTYKSGAMSINGDDAVVLYKNGSISDVFGEPNVDGTKQPWEYLDGWAYRKAPTPPSASFNIADWNFSGVNGLEGGSTNDTVTVSFPLAGLGNGNGGGGQDIVLRLISEVQGNPDTYGSNRFGDADVSPLDGEKTKLEAIVVGDFQNGDADESRNLGGFYLQEELADEDGNPLSSEGIFVYDKDFGVDVQLGDKVVVTGTIGQYFGETQLKNITAVEVLEQDQLALVGVAEISLADNEAVSKAQNGKYQPDLEAYEGMLVTITDTLSIVDQYNLDRFAELVLTAGERPYQFSQLNTPDVAAYQAHLQSVGAKRITYDDGLNEQNAEIGQLDGFADYSGISAKRMGDAVTGLSGVLDYKWAGNSSSKATWRVRAHRDGINEFTSTLDNSSPNPRPESAPKVAGDLKISSFNVLNFFTTLDENGNRTLADHRPRGADNAEEFERQQAKLVAALIELDADVLALVEVENEFDNSNDGSTAIEVLVAALNTELGADVYKAVYPGRQLVGTDAISSGVIYKSTVVNIAANTQVALLDDEAAAQLEIFAGHDFAADPMFNGRATNHVAIAVSFTHLASQDSFTLVANHFKAKASSSLKDEASPNYDKGDGAGFWNQRRLNGSIAIHAWLQTQPTGLDDSDAVIAGDLNAYAKEAPVQYLLDNGFVNPQADNAYSYIFDGQMGTLDYVLLSDSLAEKLAEASIWQINADEADALDYNLDFGRNPAYYQVDSASRNSDHDPVLVGLKLIPDVASIDDIIEAYGQGLENGSIYGTGRFYWNSVFREFRFYYQLLRVKYLFAGEKQHRACRALNKAIKRSDGERRDLITGAGVAELNSQLVDLYQAKGCAK